MVLVHGGAWDIPDAALAEHRDGLARALRVARRAVEAGRDALAVAVETVAALEDHPAFDAGRGAVLDRDGQVQLDAGVMEGETRRWGAVANVRALPNPVRAARALLDADGQARLLVGEGAERFAAEVGLPAVAPSALVVERERDRYDRLRAHPAFGTAAMAGQMDVPRSSTDAPAGTVGCVVRDAAGRLAAATSTGGAPLTRSGESGRLAGPRRRLPGHARGGGLGDRLGRGHPDRRPVRPSGRRHRAPGPRPTRLARRWPRWRRPCGGAPPPPRVACSWSTAPAAPAGLFRRPGWRGPGGVPAPSRAWRSNAAALRCPVCGAPACTTGVLRSPPTPGS